MAQLYSQLVADGSYFNDTVGGDDEGADVDSDSNSRVVQEAGDVKESFQDLACRNAHTTVKRCGILTHSVVARDLVPKNITRRDPLSPHGTRRWRHSGPSRTHHDVLGVARDATAAEVKAAYIALAKLHHPDVAMKRVEGEDADRSARDTASVELMFKEISTAYEVLKDPAKRLKFVVASFCHPLFIFY